MQKIFRSWLGILFALVLIFPSSLIVSDKVDASESTVLDVSRSIFSLTEKRTVDIQADLGENIDLDNLEFEFGGKSLSEWKKWSGGTNYEGKPFINVIEGPSFVDDTNEVQATIEFDLPYDRTDLSNRTIRTQYQDFIGDYELAVINPENEKKAAATVKLNVYDQFMFYGERVSAINNIIEQSNEVNDRYVGHESLGKTQGGRDLNFVVLAKSQEAVDKYLNETLPMALEDPESLIEKIENGTMGDYQVPIWFNNMHADEVEGPDAQIELLEKFATENEVTFDMQSRDDGQKRSVTLDVDEVLDDVIFLLAFEQNPDGRDINTRGNLYGFDPNRDNAFQTQIEQQLVTAQVAKWTPLSYIDMHGYVKGFLIEPTTPPQNPNYEYDLLFDRMIEEAHHIGEAGLGNSNLDSYFFPIDDMESGWDSMNPGYGPSLAMLHGALAHTVEVPDLGQDSYNAMYGVSLGTTLYVTENKDELYKNQLEVFKRGIKGEDNRAVDEYLVNVEREQIGRQRGDHDSYFPDYYVIPQGENQMSQIEAYNMVEYFLRNRIKVEQTTESTNVNGKIYLEGTFVIPMKQAKRGLVNAVLSDGEDVSDWDSMYDPTVVDFPALRGFDADEIREPEAFTGITQAVESITLPTGEVVETSSKQVLKNSNNDTIKLVNELLAEGKIVEKATETTAEANIGDFIVNTDDLKPYEGDYYFESKPLDTSKQLKVEQLNQPKVAFDGSSQMEFSLKELGFNVVDQEDASVVVSDGRGFNLDNLSGKSFVGIGTTALNTVKNSGVLPEFNFKNTGRSHEGSFKTKVNNDHMLTSGYQEDEIFYTTWGAWITSVPEDAEVLATFSDEDDFYIAGWWPGNEGAQGQTLAFTQNLEDTKITLFANDLAFRAHTKHSYRLLANSIFSSDTTEIPVIESVADMMDLIEDYENTGEFKNDQVARALSLHLIAVNLYEEKELYEKVVKHLEGFKPLLDHQLKEELISDKAYNTLKAGSDYLIEKWQ